MNNVVVGISAANNDDETDHQYIDTEVAVNDCSIIKHQSSLSLIVKGSKQLSCEQEISLCNEKIEEHSRFFLLFLII